MGLIHMDKEELLKKVAPCSLVCHTCSVYEHGVICKSAKQLLRYLEGFYEFNEKHLPYEVERYITFQEKLIKYSLGKCSGCRDREDHGFCIKGCFLLECTKGRGISYCGECTLFPCNKVAGIFPEKVYAQWLKGNQEVKELGIEGFWNKNCEKPHYEEYKK